jgi:hypothetical protein
MFLLRSFRGSGHAGESFAPVLMWKLIGLTGEGDSMPHEILDSMRALREDMRQRLLQVPEYRALVSLDRSIDELCAILDETMAPQPVRAEYVHPHPVATPAPIPVQAPALQAPALQAAPIPQPPEAAQARAGGIASAFAETLAAKIDQRNLARASAAYAPAHRAIGA